MINENLKPIENEMEEIINFLQKWDYEYYVLDNPSVEDSIYDQKLNKLKNLELNYNLVLSDSPTNKLNSKIYNNSQFKLIRREKPMLSIDSVNNFEDLLEFDKRVKKTLKEDFIDYICELKIDGLSASLIYKNGNLFQISTRGDGFLGEDVTFNKEVVSDIPFSLNNFEDCEVRGEIYMRKDEFIKINEEIIAKGLKKLSNARNAAAGTLRTLIPSNDRNLNFFAYRYFSPEIKNQKDCLEKLRENNFVIGKYEIFSSIEEVFTYAQYIEKNRENLNFSIDGIVIKVNSYNYYDLLGETNKFPRWAIAYKFTSQTAITTLKNINTEVSKNGRISYVAVVEPVNLDGSLISNVTLHNYGFIKKKLINIGDEIIIKKAGDVVPQLSQVIKKNGNLDYWTPLNNCSSCNSNLVWNENNLYQICNNEDCFEKNINYLTYFASKSAINMKGISKAIVEKLYISDLVKKPYDFYELKNKKEYLWKIETFKEKTINNILNSIEKSRYQRLSDFVSSFSIPLLSSVKAKKFTSLFDDNSDKLLEFISIGSFDLIEEKLGKKTKESVEKFFSNLDNLENFKKTITKMIFLNY
ncbi:MAG: DNA ligase [Mycoplasmataceae bacterium]|nr:MAG: DNA ligase [Mycoplasmataceae bacterium]